MMRWLLPVFAALVVGASATAGPQGAETNEPDCRIPPRLVAVRPDQEGPPVRVRVGLYVIDVASIQEVTESFTSDFVLVVRWIDPRLAEESLGETLEHCSLELDEIWHPEVQVVNLRRIWSRIDPVIRVDHVGRVEVRQRLSAELSSPFALRTFPFDKQILLFRVVSTLLPDDVLLESDATTSGLLDGATLAGWTLVERDVEPAPREVLAMGRRMPVLELTVGAERRIGYYVWNTFIPMTLIVFMASIVFWIDPKDFGPQVGISTASVFSLIAYLMTLRRLLPKVSYITLADVVVLGSMLLVFAALTEAVLASRLVQAGRRSLSLRIEWYARWLYPLSYLLLILAVVVVGA